MEKVRQPETTREVARPRHRLGVRAGTALCVGAILGPGVLTLPSSAAAAAGPASLVAWVGLVILSLPVALSFAALGGRYPDGGGVATYVHRAFGAAASAPVGWWFYWGVPIGVSSGALIGGEYVALAAGWGPGAAPMVALLVLAAAALANLAGLQMSGRVQLLMVGLLAVLLLVTITVAAGHVQADNFRPFLPQGWTSIGSAASVLFFAFAGWEAISHLSAEFAAPRRDLPKVTLLSWGIVSSLYIGLAVVTIGVLGGGAGRTTTPLTLVLEAGIGSPARMVAAAVGLFLTFGAVNAYLAGGARLGAALGRDGALPRTLVSDTSEAGTVPRRSLVVITVTGMAITLAAAVNVITLDTLLRATSACLTAVTMAGVVAAVVLLPRGSALRTSAIVGSVVIAVVLGFCGLYLLLPAGLAGGAVAYRALRGRGAAGPDRTPVKNSSERSSP